MTTFQERLFTVVPLAQAGSDGPGRGGPLRGFLSGEVAIPSL